MHSAHAHRNICSAVGRPLGQLGAMALKYSNLMATYGNFGAIGFLSGEALCDA